MSTIKAPRFALLQGETDCYKCGKPVVVAAIAVPPETVIEDDEYPVGPGEHGWLGLSELEELPAAVMARMVQLAPGFRSDASVTAGMRYLMNHCSCGAKLGDFYLHSSPDGPFFGEELEGLKAWVVAQPLQVHASFSEGPLGDWLQRTLD